MAEGLSAAVVGQYRTVNPKINKSSPTAQGGILLIRDEQETRRKIA